MGWFWAETPTVPSIINAPHPMPRAGATPPPACPMHDASSPISPFNARKTPADSGASSCPVKSPPQAARYPTETPASTSNKKESISSKLNPLNYMPNLSNTRPEDSPQAIDLPLEREPSSIPRGDMDANWEYPSPQQMYNAMLRKGYTDTPIDAVESMVSIHNFLNEGAWAEIVEWENIFSQGLMKGWDRCKEGEEGLARDRARREFMKARREALGLKSTSTNPTASPSPTQEPVFEPKLLRFQGRPQEPTPKSRILQALGMVMPEKFGTQPPFDRHDWFVARRQPDGSAKEVRYVIDYYGGGLQATGEPVFYLDIRPAIDRPTAAAERAIRWGGDLWYRASGGAARLDKDN